MMVFSYGGWLPIRQSQKPYPSYLAFGIDVARRNEHFRLVECCRKGAVEV
jgi:hypothetical protein